MSRSPPKTTVSPFTLARLHESVDAREVIGVDQRRDRGLGLAAVTEHVSFGRDLEALDEGVANRRLDEESRAGETDLTRRRRT